MAQTVKAVGKSDKGLVRTGNEDFYFIDEKKGLFVVCDGMGGHKAGEVASMMACEVIQTIFNSFRKDIAEDKHLDIKEHLTVAGDLLVRSVRLANHAIYSKAAGNPSLHGMGTTVVALNLENDMLSIAHVGDSRAYKILDKSLEPLTIDHSWIAEIKQAQNISEEEASSFVGKNIITRALGVRETVEVDYRMIKVKKGDKFMICSDGLCGFADDEDIFMAMRHVKDNNKKIVNELVNLANDRGGSDNVTVVVLEINDTNSSVAVDIPLVTIPAESEFQLASQNEWIKKINEYFSKKNSTVKPKVKAEKKSFLPILFSIFIIIAIAVIYLASTN